VHRAKLKGMSVCLSQLFALNCLPVSTVCPEET
jgi:hypothetical protein